MQDYLAALLFWLVYEVMSWPMRLALQPLRMAPDLTRFISRVAGPVTIALVVWLVAHAGVPLGFASAWAWFALFGALGWLVCRAFGRRVDWIGVVSPIGARGRRGRDLFLELFGLLVFLSFVAFRRWVPEMSTHSIDGGSAEKFANSMFFWSNWWARAMPPDDYWLTGRPQAYYYFGHFFWAWIGRAAALPGEWIVTLSLARLVLLVWESSYLLLRAFGARSISASLGAFFITWGGNPHAVKLYLDLRATGAETLHYYNWFMASRVIANTVNEFPSWSAILGDFHAHHLSLPWSIAFVAIALRADRWFGLRRGARAMRLALWGVPFVALGVAATIGNLWVGPLIGVAAFSFLLWRAGWGLDVNLGRAIALAALALLLFCSIKLVRGPLEAEKPPPPTAAIEKPLAERLPLDKLPPHVRSTHDELFGLWGFQAMLLVAGAVVCGARRPWPRARLALLGVAVVLVAAKLLIQAQRDRHEPALYWLAILFGVASMGVGARPWLARGATVLTALGCLLLAGLENFSIVDSMGRGVNVRYNSYFKMSYPVWPILGAGAWMVAHRCWTSVRRIRRPPFSPLVRWAARAPLLLLIPPVMGMVAFGMTARILQAQDNDTRPRRPTLSAYSWLELRRGYEGEAEMLAFIRGRVPPRERVVEAAIDAGYAYNGRVASLAGRPIPLGWGHHEFQWRGAAAGNAVAANRRAAEAIYRAPDPAALLDAARRFDARWIVFGVSESRHYGPVDSARILENLRRAAETTRGFPTDAPATAFLFELPR